MSRPESPHVSALKTFREQLIEQRREVPDMADIDGAMRRIVEVEAAISAVDKAIDNELDLTPIPRVDDPTQPAPKL